MSEGPYEYSQPNTPQPPQTKQGSASEGTSKKPFRILPTWWWVFIATLLIISFFAAGVERAISQLILNAAVFFGLLIVLVRYCIWGNGRFAIRALPLLGFLLLLGTALATIRVDDMDGNLIPRRVSWRWDKQRDEKLAAPEVQVADNGIDLLTTTENDFPEFLGPNRDGTVNVSFATDWAKNPPEKVWVKEEFGAGWSGFVASNGYAVTLEQRGESEITSCYEIATGEMKWSHAETARHLTVPGGIGPRSTPTIYKGNVYSLGGTGILCCLDGSNGELLWRRNLQEEINTTPEQELSRIAWGRSSSPLLDNDRVIVPLGMPGGASLVAYDAETGDELWRSGQRQISYASPMITTLGGVRQIVSVCESHVCGFDAETGDPLWEVDWPGSSSGNASCTQPIAIDDNRLFLSKGYAHGSSLVSLKQVDANWQVEQLWHSSRSMKTKFSNPVRHEGFIYGLSDGILSCAEIETGKTQWKRGRLGHGQVLRTNSGLIVQAENGDVLLVQLTPKRFKQVSKFSPLVGKTWNNLCLYGNYLLVRNGEQAACYRLADE